MKKIAIAILAFVYISTSTGMVLHTHYCMGEPVAWGLGQNKSKTCSKCGMPRSDEKNSGCCKDEYKYVKNDKDQVSGDFATLTETKLLFTSICAQPVSICPLSPFSTVKFLPLRLVKRSYSYPLNVINCTFRIWFGVKQWIRCDSVTSGFPA